MVHLLATVELLDMMQGEEKKGYQHEYLRKQRVKTPSLLEPPSLLTDRSAYVNFLEEQLERVSSACMVVSAYDQRFNEMQALIVSLESRLSTNTKLLSIAQKCTEEVKIDLDTRLDGLIEKVKKDHEGYEKNISNHASRIEEAEEAITDLSILPGRVHNLETRMSESDGTIRAIIEENILQCNTTNERLEKLETVSEQNAGTVEKINNTLNKHIRSTVENERDLNNLILSVEARLKDVHAVDRADALRRVQSVESASKAEGKRLSELIVSLKESSKNTFIEVDKKAIQQNEDMMRTFKSMLASMEEERTLSFNTLRKDINAQTHNMESVLATAQQMINSQTQDLQALKVDSGRSFDVVNERLSINEKDVQSTIESMGKFKPLISAIAAQVQLHNKSQNKLEESVRVEKHKLRILQQREMAFELRQAKIDKDIKDREKDFEEKQSHIDSKIQEKLITEHKANELNKSLIKAQAARQAQQIAIIEAQLHADEDIMKDHYEKLKELQEHEDQLDNLVGTLNDNKRQQQEDIYNLEQEFKLSVLHKEDGDRKLQSEINLEKQAMFMSEEHMKAKNDNQEQRNAFVNASLGNNNDFLAEQQAKLKGMEVKEETLRHLLSDSKKKWESATQAAEPHRAVSDSIPTSFPLMERKINESGEVIATGLDQSLSSDSAVGNVQNNTIQNALNQFFHEYKTGGGSNSRSISLSPPRVQMVNENKQRQSHSVSPDRNRQRNVWNYSRGRSRITRRVSRREQKDRDNERSAHGSDVRRAILMESFALSDISENSMMRMDTTQLTRTQLLHKADRLVWYPTKTVYRGKIPQKKMNSSRLSAETLKKLDQRGLEERKHYVGGDNLSEAGMRGTQNVSGLLHEITTNVERVIGNYSNNTRLGGFVEESTSSETSSIPTVDVLAERPHRACIEPSGNITGFIKIKKRM